jgi:hypothetical protein
MQQAETRWPQTRHWCCQWERTAAEASSGSVRSQAGQTQDNCCHTSLKLLCAAGSLTCHVLYKTATWHHDVAVHVVHVVESESCAQHSLGSSHSHGTRSMVHQSR